ncbi:hypothetical protein BAUCODRAFT_481272 [Baudoinia panamericana UAMH 10762]|uniref:Uncharacterized protein n=1 Tax=Baudoinia panamericana (strain UAMH 10762) TaxID=717646 RepID=M2NBQ8_BAUPA|nr:uncharacterized protein BAUCODRAFT_481272 [Baudoinia panamericana UAMH 10762]EMC96579.1 hypothetical protein BAUCODRAFT_481272 [Baudoinia panamericana UAMH 10762]
MSIQSAMEGDDFPEGIETLYLSDGKPAGEDIRNASPSTTPRVWIRQKTSFLDLPGEVRIMIYALALQSPNYVRLLFRYDCEFNPNNLRSKGHIPNTSWFPVKRKIPLIESDILNINHSKICEQLPPLTHAIPLLTSEILSAQYAVNGLHIPLRNALERQMCVRWIRDRGRVLRGVTKVKVQLPWILVGSIIDAVATLTKRNPTADGVKWQMRLQGAPVPRGFCICTAWQWAKRTLEHHGSCPRYTGVRELGIGLVMESVVDVCEALELAETTRAAMMSSRDHFDGQCFFWGQKRGVRCEHCAERMLYAL